MSVFSLAALASFTSSSCDRSGAEKEEKHNNKEGGEKVREKRRPIVVPKIERGAEKRARLGEKKKHRTSLKKLETVRWRCSKSRKKKKKNV